MQALRPITSRLSARLRGLSPFDDAVDVIEVDGPTEWELKPIITLPGERERAIGHSHITTPEKNETLLHSPVLKQGPCRLHRVRDAIVVDGTLLTKRSFESMQNRPRHWLLSGEPTRIEEAALCSTWATELYFGHWLHDGLAHELLAEEYGKKPIVLTGVNRPNEPGYRKLVGLEANPVTFARIRDLWLLEDWELTRHRVARLQELKKRLRAQFPDKGPEYVFVSRGQMATGRSLSNEAEVASTLEARGFAVLRPEGMEPDQIVRSLKDARIVVGVEGSSLSHVLLASPSTSGMLTVTGPRSLNMHFRGYTAVMGMRYSYLVGDATGPESFSQPIDRLLKTIDLLDTALG